MTHHNIRTWSLTFLSIAVVLIVGAGAADPAGHARQVRKQPAPIPFPVADLFFELNDSAGDLGIHAEIDGGPWTSLDVEGPGDRTILSIVSRSRLRLQGLTQLAFESAEPAFSELDPEVFFRRFPEGTYEISARAQDGGTFESTVALSHVMAAPVGDIRVNGLPAAASCDALSLPEVDAPVLIDWEPVVSSHPTIGREGPVAIARYQFFVELPGGKMSIDLPPTQTEYEAPVGSVSGGTVLKFEIIARTASGNNTATESCFRLR